MASLNCANVYDLYGETFGMTPEQIVKRTLKQNEQCANEDRKYQQFIKENELAGKISNQSQEKESNSINNQDNSQNLIPNNIQNLIPNNTQFARRVAQTDKNNIWPSNTGFSQFNRFQDPMGVREYFTENFGNSSNNDMSSIIDLLTQILMVLKIIMLVLVLIFLIKILEKRN